MKRLILSILPLWVGCALSAQTYHDGVWYSIYDDATHTMNTQGDYETGGVFAPTTGTLNVKWRYEWIDWLGAFAKIDTEVLTSADNGNNTTKVGKLAENTGKNSNTTESFAVGRNINWIKFNRTGLPTHKVHVYHIDIPLAKHILLASGDYGTATTSYDFGEQDALSISEPYMVNLRSFLSAGDITVTSSDPEIFHLGSAESIDPIVYAVGANACASANGTADAASGAALGKIANYAFPVYFTPKQSGSYTGTITLTDGVSTATITLSGTGRKLNQSITWDQEKTTILSNETIAPATASSSLQVTYTFSPEGIVTFADGVFSILSDGQVTVTAAQSGNNIYNAAESVAKTFTIFPAVTYNTYEASICEGEVYNDEHFGTLTEGRLYYDTIPNVYGGDSVITLTLHVLPTYAFPAEATMKMNESYVWRERTYQGLVPGVYTFADSLLTKAGCDSVYTLTLNVEAIPYLIEENLSTCQNEEAAWREMTLPSYEAGTFILYDSLLSQYGTDSVYELTLTVYPSYAFEDEAQTIYVGQPGVWREINLSLIPVGDTILTKVYTTVTECDSVYTMHLTVNEAPATYGVDSIYICGRGAVAFYDDVAYSRPSKTPLTVTLSTPNQFGGDSIVELWVLASNKYEMSFSKTITEGAEEVWQDIDLSLIPAGDTTLTVIYPTIHGCDSTFILNLTVVGATPTGINNVQGKTRPAEKFFLNGQLYIRKDERLYTPQGALIETKKED